jgi:hypothetical protein
MTDASFTERWRALVAVMQRGEMAQADIRDRLEDLLEDVKEELFGPPGSPSRGVDPADPRLAIALDALQALGLIEPTDPAYPWERAGLLDDVDRHLEAADDYLTSARLTADDAVRGDSAVPDPEDWAASALWHAARQFVLGGQPAAAASILPRLSGEDRAEIESLLAAEAAQTG